MKHLMKGLTAILAVLLISSCGAAYQQTKAEKAALVIALRNSNFNLDVTQIIPVGFPSKNTMGEYSLSLQGNIVDTRLPYIGVSHSPHFGDDDISIVFDKEEVDVKTDFSKASKGEYSYRFKGGKGIDPWTVQLTVFDNGTAYIDCYSDEGRAMHYYANVTLLERDGK